MQRCRSHLYVVAGHTLMSPSVHFPEVLRSLPAWCRITAQQLCGPGWGGVKDQERGGSTITLLVQQDTHCFLCLPGMLLAKLRGFGGFRGRVVAAPRCASSAHGGVASRCSGCCSSELPFKMRWNSHTYAALRGGPCFDRVHISQHSTVPCSTVTPARCSHSLRSLQGSHSAGSLP